MMRIKIFPFEHVDAESFREAHDRTKNIRLCEKARSKTKTCRTIFAGSYVRLSQVDKSWRENLMNNRINKTI